MNPNRKTRCLTYGDSDKVPQTFEFSRKFKQDNFGIAGTLCGRQSRYIYLAADFDLGPKPKDVCYICWSRYRRDVEVVS